MVERLYSGEGLRLRIRGLGTGETVRVHLEHDSGAALIVPGCEEASGDAGPRLKTVGFDGTVFTIELDEKDDVAKVVASRDTPILGGGIEARIPRGPDLSPNENAIRVTGDEETMPIQVK